MSSWINKLLVEQTVYWTKPTRDGLGDYFIWPDPVQLLGRWQYDKLDLEYQESGAIAPNRSSVWVDAEIIVGGYLWKGVLADLTGNEPPGSASQIISVQMVRSIPRVVYLYKAYLDVR